MKVSLATLMFNHSVATAVELYVERPPEDLQAVAFLPEINKLWEFVNSSSNEAPLRKKAVSLQKL